MSTMVLGLTGGIATGKSTVSSFFRELNIPVIDADIIAKQVTAPNSKALQQIEKHFGVDAINEDGTMNRKYVGQRVFANQTELEVLNNITAPLIRAEIISKLASLKKLAVKLIVLDMPLLYEQHYEDVVDQVMVVATPVELQLQRLIERNHLTSEAAQQRIKAQLPLTDKMNLADIVIDNSGDVAETKQQVLKWLGEQSFRNEE